MVAAGDVATRTHEVLSHGRVRRMLGSDGQPEVVVEVHEPSWAPAWYAAENWLRSVADRPDRIRPCANDACVLHFYDVSKNGTRPLVLDGRMRQPRQGATALRPSPRLLNRQARHGS